MSDPALDPQRNVSVAASAGTGKTWLLTARIVRLLLAGQEAGGILALTFTRKAAAEMRERVAARLRALAFADDTALAMQLAEIGLACTPELAQRARGLYEELQFSPWPLRAMTLHAFCQELVARFALQCGVTPGAELVESEGELLAAAWQSLQQALLRQPDSAEAQALRSLIADGHSEAALRGLVMGFLERRNDWRAFAAPANDPLARLDATLRERLALDTRAQAASAVDAPAFDAGLAEFMELLRAIGGTQYVKPEKVAAAQPLRGAERLHVLAAGLYKKDGSGAYSFKLSKDHKKILSGAQQDRIAQLHADLVQSVGAALEHARRLATLQRTLAACTLGAAALQALETELQRRAALPFPELEWHASRLLADPETSAWVQYKLDQRVDHLLVDEFQDTSNTQWRLLLPLLEEMAAGGTERSRSAFIVGDVKQSIYGFRRANPELMIEAERWLGENLQGLRAELSDSRRSSPAVIGLVNAVFAVPEVRAQLPGFPEHGTHRRDDWGRVELTPLVEDEPGETSGDPPFRNPLTTPRSDPENTRAKREGEQIAARIEALVAARHDLGGRALGAGDIMILLRKRTHQQAIEQALTARGIPFTGAARGTLLDTVEARDLTALLRFLNSPERDLDLAHVLRSPLFDCSDADLAAIAAVARARECCWFDALEPQRAAPLAGWLTAARQLPPHDLLDRIYAEGNIAARYEAALPPVSAARVRANLNAYLQLALEVDSGRYPSLSKFLRQLQQWSGKDAPDEAPPRGSGAQVRIMTIHAAKGLEAPAVFLAQTASPGPSSKAGWLVDWPQGAAAPDVILLGGSKDEHDALTAQLLDERSQREAREDLNLLYVALTRARQFLHISGFAPKRAGSKTSWHALALSAMTGQGAATQAGIVCLTAGQPQPWTGTEVQPQGFADDPRLRQPLPGLRSARPAPGALATGEPEPEAVRRGNGIHLLLQLLTATPEAAATSLRARLQARIECSAAEAGEWLAQAQRVIAAPELARFFDRTQFKRAWNEVPLHDGETAGVMDRLVDDGQALWILDYKTHRAGSDATLLDAYRRQLGLYREGVQRLWPDREVHAGLVLTAQTRWLECVF